MINKLDAIEAIKALPRWVIDSNGEYQPVDANTSSMIDPEDAVSAIENLPSVQPEIIHCKDCKWKQGSECTRFAEVRPFPNDFCSKAERRTDETD